MLYFKTVEPGTLRILRELMEMSELAQFNLVGGTALSLQLGHRTSDDIDLFNHKDFNKREIIDALKQKFKERFSLLSKETNPLGIFSFIDDVKIDICKHPFPIIDDVITEEGIRMWSIREIAAAKVHAISMRAKKKDFWDIDKLLDIFSIEEIASFYRKKYDPLIALGVAKIITYFADAENSEAPFCFQDKNWEMIKESIARKVNQKLKQ